MRASYENYFWLFAPVPVEHRLRPNVECAQSCERAGSIDNWPPYVIAGLGEDDYRITIAVAGVSQDKLTITQEQNMLMVSGQKPGEDNSLYLHRGVAGRRFELAAQVKVARARLVGEKPPRAERSGSHQA
ncbi:Hsp20 family protein [Sphingopyxis granuli]|uniref:Heat-shock protein Hsp20 n=2 Tax=Alphaproteobacteria TaxID=28211 RepID=A0A1V8RQM3_9HYPH|nr:Hsp20 family protein [Sphingopyxis granuli]AMG72566.1 Molecular chaperone Hsp20 [Sphingopyxis granuli]OQM75492.1 heat-shock protein Hsp20 [Pseudaminobacter manganicus]